jgi:hypothetical protein
LKRRLPAVVDVDLPGFGRLTDTRGEVAVWPDGVSQLPFSAIAYGRFPHRHFALQSGGVEIVAVWNCVSRYRLQAVRPFPRPKAGRQLRVCTTLRMISLLAAKIF